jgi:RHS repeat-associated protein
LGVIIILTLGRPHEYRYFIHGLKSSDGMIHTDHLGTPHKMTDANQVIVWSTYYKPFGAATIAVSTITNNLRFPGQYFDVETGLNYNYFRDYNPAIGRYIEADPFNLGAIQVKMKNMNNVIGIKPYISVPQKQHLFIYAIQNPIINQDPLGLQAARHCPCGQHLGVDWDCVKVAFEEATGGLPGTAALVVASVIPVTSEAAAYYAWFAMMLAIADCTKCIPN